MECNPGLTCKPHPPEAPKCIEWRNVPLPKGKFKKEHLKIFQLSYSYQTNDLFCHMLIANSFIDKPHNRWPKGCLDCSMGGQMCCFYGNGTQECTFMKDCPTAPKPIPGKLSCVVVLLMS